MRIAEFVRARSPAAIPGVGGGRDIMRYFVAGNVWLVIALAVFLGKTFERSSPTMYSFFGVGGWMTPATYNMALLFCVALAAAFFTMAWKLSPARIAATKEMSRAFD